MIADARPLARLLLESARGDAAGEPLGDAAATPLGSVLAAGREHRITPAIARRLAGAPDLRDDWRAALAAGRTAQLIRHMCASGDLRVLSSVFEGEAIAWAVGKGPVAADLIWPSPDMREYYDLDVFVGRHDFARALEALLAAGCHLVDRNWPELSRSMRAEIALRGPAGSHIDLHWDIAVPPKLRRAFRTDMAGMLGRARHAELGSGVGIRVFDAVDTVAHLVFHAAQAGANRLMWMADIRFAVSAEGFDWAEFQRRSARAGTQLPAALVLTRVAGCLGFPEASAPPAALLAPANGVWGNLARRRDARYPFPGLPGDPHQSGALFSSARGSLAASAVELAATMLRTRTTERRVDRRGPDERVLYRDVPDARARRAYLSAVSG